MKCYVLGDSHIGALRSAIDKFGMPSGVEEVIFYAGPSATMGDLILRDGKLIPTTEKLSKMLSYTSGGKPVIDIKSADIIVIHGLSLSISVCKRILDKHTIESGQCHDLSFITLACFTQAIADNLQQRLALQILKMVRQVTNKPIILSQTPFPDVRLAGYDDARWNFLKGVNKKSLYDAFNNGCNNALSEYKAKYVPQPESTLINYVYTGLKYSKESRGIGRSMHDESDIGHMNHEYGKLVWSDLATLLWTPGFLSGHPVLEVPG